MLISGKQPTWNESKRKLSGKELETHSTRECLAANLLILLKATAVAAAHLQYDAREPLPLISFDFTQANCCCLAL
jgi:hypothetical protein